MICKYCGKDSGDTDVCNDCNEKINNYMQNDNTKENASEKQDNNLHNEQMEVRQSEETVVKNKGYFSIPRIIAILGAVIFAFCCIMPQYLVDDLVKEVALAKLSSYGIYIFLFPFLNLVNAIYDKRISFISLIIGSRGKYLRFKLCILWGLTEMFILFAYPYITSHNVIGYTFFYYLSWIGAIMAVVAPFLVKENDGTGIKPLKKYDYVWIVIVVVAIFVACARIISVNG